MRSPHIRDKAQGELALKVQIKSLIASSNAFDAGERWEAVRLATAVHTVVHDASKKQPSLLTVIQAKQGTKFLSSGPPINPRNALASMPLVLMRLSPSGGTYLPILGDDFGDHRWLPFSRWWEDDPIYSGPFGERPLSRKNLTFALRNKEGGSHYDPQVFDESYLDLKNKEYAIAVIEGVGSSPLIEAELTTMRQIAWELLETLKARGFNDEAKG